MRKTHRYYIGALGGIVPHKTHRSSLRVGPGRGKDLLTSLWRIWAQGNEVYLANRNLATRAHVSLHSTGKWFIDLGPKRIQFVPPMRLEGSNWLHAVEIAFLIGENVLPMPEMKEVKAARPALKVEVPPGHKLVLNILYGSEGVNHDTAVPQLIMGSVLLQLTLRDGIAVAVVARVLRLSDQDRHNMLEMPKAAPKLTTVRPVSRGNVGAELINFTATETGGNVITVIPLSPENFVQRVQV
ncbi:MAG TPA: hypothetical protein VIH60_04865 [Steroidobacteraceae bacterium]